MQNKLILTDVDGVLLDFEEAFGAFIKDKTGQELGVYLKNREQEEHLKNTVEFYHSDYFRYMKPVKGAVETCQSLYDHGYRFVAITSCDVGRKEQCMETTYRHRYENLKDHFGSLFEQIHITNRQQGKKETLKQFPASWWIDDHLHNIKHGDEAGHKSVILKSFETGDLKAEDKKYSFAENWSDIDGFIRKETKVG